MSKPPCHLQGLGVLVTRPAEAAARLGEAVETAHGRPILFPAVEIAAAAEPEAVRTQLKQAGRYDLLIFVSRNAVEYGFDLLPDTLPASQQVAAVGASTAAALEDCGLEPTLVPQRYDSEGLLELPQLADMTGKRVLILRGNGGRELLADTLRERGAEVDYAEVYRRLIPQRSAANLVKGWENWIDVVVVSSGEILDNLVQMLGDDGLAKLQQTPLVVVSERIAEQARTRGLRKLHLAANATDDAILAALCELA